MLFKSLENKVIADGVMYSTKLITTEPHIRTYLYIIEISDHAA